MSALQKLESGASALVSIFTMGAFALFGWICLADQEQEAPSQ
jgi:hypothetical protein